MEPRKLNICLISYEFPPHIYGGSGTYAGLLYKGLTEKGNKVTVIAHGDYDEDKILRINTPDIKYWRRLFFTHYAGNMIKKLHKIDKFDIIHYNEPHIILNKPDIPSVSTFHSTQINELFIKLRLSKMVSTETIIETLIKSPIGSIGDIISTRKSDMIICPNNHLKYMISKYCLYNEDYVKVINNGIDTGEDEEKAPDILVVNNHTLVKDKYLLYVGRIDPIKGIEYLIKAFNAINKKHDIKLVIAGSGFYESHLRKNSNLENVLFLGYVSDKKTLSLLYSNSLMVILPSLYEALPMVLLEAMSHSKPIIATNVGGIPDFITDGENGFLVEPKNSQKLVDRIEYLLENPGLAEKIGYTNREKVRESYSLDLMVNKTLRVYDRVLNNRN